jgi:hypothetical protein
MYNDCRVYRSEWKVRAEIAKIWHKKIHETIFDLLLNEEGNLESSSSTGGGYEDSLSILRSWLDRTVGRAQFASQDLW